jgi:hypothetical protein
LKDFSDKKDVEKIMVNTWCSGKGVETDEKKWKNPLQKYLSFEKKIYYKNMKKIAFYSNY